ncbi:hypothetical protein EVB81_102 [Rhizobium phage RHph_I46]|uniref:Uncharacterized protein n=1 Tax=Rhizobium phage RHph_I1_9 TaxID=2509729 RepID=A0A7S5UZL9_9CAUD|nr:hypothetical protein PP936_gp101 [Rhizobium phage RHph_I1_9]QIG69671.1 hypothetical protein EVB81_102 [Rhizobium phage RHph_I46]QIG70952.1 hypothetical protein EVB92_102 [Rhizobium phage RHph_I9]QIG73538.1 hypothetical protein EVC04_101 [Rhizobium phage RHph_I1_9]QIG76291.1 hypothetical protein EVC25_102 [Rhizobium phage RHph_I34]
MSHYCTCKKCKKMRRKGLVLGTRRMGFWLTRFGKLEYYLGPVSDYVRHPRFFGRRPDPKFDKKEIAE